jgi:hypothetical protein
MKTSTLTAAFFLLTTSAFAAPASHTSPTAQDCARAPAVARTYLAAQAGRKLTMSRAAVIADVTKNTGADGEFAGLKPCDSGYANAVRFYIDEVLKAGTDNSTPKTDDESSKR